MRQVVLDTETTGLAVEEGHRIIEIGCIEIKNRRITDASFHHYLNPEREIDAGAIEVHGITREKLQTCPRFQEVAHDLIEFIRGSEVIIHNAAFDVGFINAELALLGPAWGRMEDYCHVFDTLKLARELHPGQRNSLDALCKRYEVDNTNRAWHGALLDARLLADVYLGMTGGQTALGLDSRDTRHEAASGTPAMTVPRPSSLKVIPASAEDLAAHQARLQTLDKRAAGGCLWLKQP